MLSPWLWHLGPWAVPLRQTSMSPFEPNPKHLYSHRAMDRQQQHACSTTLPAVHTAVSHEVPGEGHSHHPKTPMCTFWDGFASSPTSLGSMDILFISCQSSCFYSATLRLQKDYEKKADLALHFWHHIGRTTKPFLKSEIRCDGSFSWLTLTLRLWILALSSFKWNYH